jgi:hypothetical protein
MFLLGGIGCVVMLFNVSLFKEHHVDKRDLQVVTDQYRVAQVAHNSILAMGLVGCGTNNARVAAMLRNLAVYYHKDEHNLFMTRLAQGLLHMGKGTMTISPYHTDRSLVRGWPIFGPIWAENVSAAWVYGFLLIAVDWHDGFRPQCETCVSFAPFRCH